MGHGISSALPGLLRMRGSRPLSWPVSQASGTCEGSWWPWGESSSVSHLAGGAQLVAVALCPGARADGFPCYEWKLTFFQNLVLGPCWFLFRMRPLGKETEGLSPVSGGGTGRGLDEGAASFDSVPCHAKSLQSCPTLCHPVDYSPPGSSVPGILQARILEWVTVLFSRGSSQPRDRTHIYISCIGRQVLYH